jgi:hypothetical protein
MSNRKSLHVKGLMFIGFFLTLFVANGRAQLLIATPAGECNRISIKNPQPLWISSAAEWSGRVAAVDPVRNKILLIGQKDTQVYDQKRLAISTKEMMPAFLNKTSRGYALQMMDRRLFWLNEKLDKVGLDKLAEPVPDSPEKIVSTYYTVSAGSHFFSFGAVKESNGRLDFGFFHAPLSKPSRFSFLKSWADVDYYLLGYRYLASLGDDEYAVLMASGRSASIVKLSGRSEEQLDVIPAPYKSTPRLNNETTGPNSEAALFRTVEGFSIPVGLYGQDNYLYLLTREPGERGKTIWRLFQIDPGRRQEPRGVVLPTDAHHLTVVSGSSSWYFIEKGPVLPLGKQEITSMLVIPNSAIRALSVPGSCQTIR